MTVSGSHKPKLTKFFLFNTTWGPREGEEDKKIVFFWPPETEINEQVRTVGLIEAVVRFGQTFSGRPSESLHTQRTRSVWRQLEDNFLLCFTVSVPWAKKPAKDGGAEVVEYKPDEVSDRVLLGILDRAQQMFSLFSGGLPHLLATSRGDRDLVRERVRHFYTRYLASVKLEASSVLDMWGGVQYLPLDTEPFLRVQTLVNRAAVEFPEVSSCLFLHQGQLVWSEIDPDTTRLLVHYLSTTLLPSLPTLAGPPPGSAHQGRFLVPGGGPAADQTVEAVPVVHLGPGETRHLVVFHAVTSTLCLLLPAAPATQFYPRYSDYMGPLLSDLSADLTHLWVSNNPATAAGTGDSVRFIYYNGANFAVKSTVEAGNESLVNLAAELTADLPASGGEVTGKLSSDQWLVVRVAGARTVIILLAVKNLNLLEVSEEVAKLDKSSFAKICLL